MNKNERELHAKAIEKACAVSVQGRMEIEVEALEMESFPDVICAVHLYDLENQIDGSLDQICYNLDIAGYATESVNGNGESVKDASLHVVTILVDMPCFRPRS